MQYQAFNYQLEQIQGKVDVINKKIELGDESYKEMGEIATLSSSASETLRTLGIPDSTISEYRYFTPSDLEKYLDISNVDQYVAINFKTRDVVSVEGFEYQDEMYYRLYDYSDNTYENEERPRITNQYVTSGLILHYDGINNTGNGHSRTTNTWKDLSQKNNNGTLMGFDAGATWGSNYLQFDGVDDYVLSANNLGISGDAELTMCAVASWEGEEWIATEYPSYMGANCGRYWTWIKHDFIWWKTSS